MEIDGITTKSDEVLYHELVHAKDFLDGTTDRIHEEHRGDYFRIRGEMETNAVQATNAYRLTKDPGATIRTEYLGEQVVTPANARMPNPRISPF
ncbi:MAG: M91 family zinc metallopeptidase [Bacteroidota bacterium]